MTVANECVTWDAIVERCSRLHTTRTKPLWPGSSEMREASEMAAATVDGRPAEIVPTRMHEPGFYWRYMDVDPLDGTQRSDEGIDLLRSLAEAGKVRWR